MLLPLQGALCTIIAEVIFYILLKKKTGWGIYRKYFDTTLRMISNTHKFMYADNI